MKLTYKLWAASVSASVVFAAGTAQAATLLTIQTSGGLEILGEIDTTGPSDVSETSISIKGTFAATYDQSGVADLDTFQGYTFGIDQTINGEFASEVSPAPVGGTGDATTVETVDLGSGILRDVVAEDPTPFSTDGAPVTPFGSSFFFELLGVAASFESGEQLIGLGTDPTTFSLTPVGATSA